MTAHHHHLLDGYARASKRFHDAFVASLNAPPLALEAFRRHEAHAWGRLPETVKRAVQKP